MPSLALLAIVLASPKYKPVTGIAFHLCSWSAPCPCMKTKGGDMEGCQLTAVYHFDDGGYVGKDLKGLTMVVVGRPNKLIAKDKKAGIKVPLDLAVYVPKGISESQTRNLKFILVEHQSRFAWGKIDFRPAEITFRKIAHGYSANIPQILNAKTIAMKSPNGKPRIAKNVPFEEGTVWHLGKTTAHGYKDPKEKAWTWNYPANNGAWCLFSWDRIDHP